jgi:polyisoprenoid-binding protein YceI
MAKWTFEPGHTAAEFAARHMMVSWVRGAFKDVHGKMEFDPGDPASSSVEVEIDVKRLWSGDAARDGHLIAADFLDADNHPKITFKGEEVSLDGENDFRVTGALTIRGVTKTSTLNVRYLGQWPTPFWEDGVTRGLRYELDFTQQPPSTDTILA